MKEIKAIYFKLRDGFSLEEAQKFAEEHAPPPPGFPHAYRARNRAKNRRARESRRINRLRAKGAHV